MVRILVTASILLIVGFIFLCLDDSDSNNGVSQNNHSTKTSVKHTLSISTRQLTTHKSEVITTSANSEKSNVPDIVTYRIKKYQDMMPQSILIDLVKNPLESKSLTSILLALIEQGVLAPNSPLREGGNSSHYTPLYAAIYLSSSLTAEQVNQFIEAGVHVQNNSAWKRAISTQEDPQTVLALIEAGGFGVEDHGYFADKAVSGGQSKVFSMLLENGLTLDTNKIEQYEEKIRNSLLREIEKLEYSNTQSEFIDIIKSQLSKDGLSQARTMKLQKLLNEFEQHHEVSDLRSINRINGFLEVLETLSLDKS